MASESKRLRPETAIFVAHDDFKKRDIAEAERNLMRAVLQTAMEDIRKKGETYHDARRYFGSTDDYYLYSFLSICYHLDLCPRTVQTIVGLGENPIPLGTEIPTTGLDSEEDKAAA